MPARTENAIEGLGVLIQRLGILPQRLGNADDGVERRAQLVSHVGEELRLVLAGDFELLALVLDLVEQPHVLDRDRRLVGEGRRLTRSGFSVNGRASLARQRQDADRRAFAQQGYAQHGCGVGRASATSIDVYSGIGETHQEREWWHARSRRGLMIEPRSAGGGFCASHLT